METCILNHLRAFGLPEVKAFGCNDDYNILIMELLGHSLENLFQAKNRKFSLKTTLMLGIQMIERIEYIHSRKFIHRDIKPDNFRFRFIKKILEFFETITYTLYYWKKINRHCEICFS